MERKNRYARNLSASVGSADEQNASEKSPSELPREQMNLKKPKDEKNKLQNQKRLDALARVVECVPKSILNTGLTAKEKEEIHQKYISTFEEQNKKELNGCEVSQNDSSSEARAGICSFASDITRGSKLRKRKPAVVCEKYSVEQWIETVCKYYRALPTLINLEKIEIDGLVKISPKMSSKGVSAVKQLEKILDIQDKKQQYLNMYALNKQFEKLCVSKKEIGLFKCMFQHNECIREKYGTTARSAYRAKARMMLRFVNFCALKGYNSPWFYSHFAHLPVIRYDAGQVLLRAE